MAEASFPDERIESSTKASGWADICRLCAKMNDHIIPIFEAEGAQHDLSDKIHKYLPIRVAESDTLPIQLCYHCAATILAWHELLESCLDAQKQLAEMRSEQTAREQSRSKGGEDFSEEVEDPDPRCTDKEHSGTTQPGETEQSGEDTKPRFDATADARFQKFLKTEVTRITRARRVFASREQPSKLSTVREEAAPPLGRSKNATRQSAFSCDTCTRLFKRESNLKRHHAHCRGKEVPKSETDNEYYRTGRESNLSCDNESSRELRNYRCARCDYRTRRKRLLKLHVSECHEKAGAKNEGKKDRDKDIIVRARMEANGRVYYHCEDCGKNLFSPYTFAWHVKIHTGERSFTCHLCGKQFRVNQGLARHLHETHAGIKNFSCDVCSRSFSTKRNVEDHRRIHTGERPFVCNVCGKTFKQKASLFVHNRTHTDSFPFKCSYCNQGFRTRPPLVVHLTKHTGEKPHICDICERAFRIKYELKRHRLVHSDEKPWRCSDCGSGFRQKRYLVNHRKVNRGCATDTTNA